MAEIPDEEKVTVREMGIKSSSPLALLGEQQGNRIIEWLPQCVPR